MNSYLEFEDDPIKDLDLGAAGDEVAYEDEQQEMNKGPDDQTLLNGPLSSETDETSLRTEPWSKPQVSESLK